MVRYVSVIALVLLPVIAGCGRNTANQDDDTPVYKPQDYRGTVDRKLPPDLQLKQQVLGEILNALLDGRNPEDIPKYFPNVRFNESSKQFYEGSLQLIRWKFNGSPNGNVVPVILTLATVTAVREDDQAAKVVGRNYIVTGVKNGQFTIIHK